MDAAKTSATNCSLSQPVLPDGDQIVFSTECCAPPGKIGIVLQVSDKISWWKELAVGNQRISLSGRGYSIPSTPEMRVGPLWWDTNNLAGKSLVFSKAKFLGIHSSVYTIDLGTLAQFAERIVVFRWKWDCCGGAMPNPQYANATGAPYDGTLLQDDGGAIWVIAGAAGFHVPSPQILNQLFPGARPFLFPGQRPSKWPVDIPVDNTLLREENGSIWAVAGQAKFHVPDPPMLARLYPGQQPFQLWDGAPQQVPDIPVDDTLIREDNGATWVVAGRAKFHVPDPTTYNRLFGGRKLFQLWNGAPQQIPDIPRDGTMLREENGAIWVIAGKAKFHVPDPVTLARVFPDTPYFQLWDGAVQHIPDIPTDGTILCEESCQQVFIIFSGRKFLLPQPNILPAIRLWNGALAQIPS